MDDDIEFDADIIPLHTPRRGGGGAQTEGGEEESLSPLEQEVLDEYARLVGNLDDLAALLADLASKPSAEILDALRGLERKTTTVFTLLKASVYSIVLQQEINEGGGEGMDGE
ncbi:DASH complex, subunit Dad3 [Lecanosticta acicola]|uniref:DASH complex subunit DAD3 n=1 Tax=Lecanosticta acicola TaxID=111012 RepID=A0AAI8YU30_9PEZI|nr:DASH complex, subunit Dad3 [Lecanosticta acicola]